MAKYNFTPLKTALLKAGWGDAIVLLDCLIKHEPAKLEKWVKSGSTVVLKDACWRFRTWSIYSHRLDPMPFDNDVYALDAAFNHNKSQRQA
jgi:hypothetical protein